MRRGAIKEISRLKEELSLRRKLENRLCKLSCEAPEKTLEEISRELVRDLKELTGSQLAAVGVYSETKKRWYFPNFVGLNNCGLKSYFAVSRLGGVFEKVFREKRPYVSNALSRDPHHRGLPEGHVPIKRVLIHPVVVKDRIKGLMMVANAPRRYGAREREIVEKLGSFYGFLLQMKEGVASPRNLNGDPLLDTQRARTLNLLVGNLAHKFNNLLNVIWASLEFAKFRPEHRPFEPFLEKAERASQELSGLVRQLLLYARGEVLGKKLIHLEEFIPRVTEFLRSLLPPQIELRTRVKKKLPPVRVDPVALEQILVNLVVNAAEAYSEKEGSILVRVDLTSRHHHLRTSRTPYRVRFCSGIPAKQWIVVEVKDQGRGIPPELLPRVAEPFYSTKGLGRGLGLAAVRNIIWAHDGCLSLFSSPEKGTSVKVYLPLSEDNQK
ncbi:GAF domain-containing protein [Thermosulfurimonas marina]|uniref:histidine kinase n=1 Tax=Thermosulfurimonas marina TaxID=2047767 RepID=A0A6H1WQG0_9BACT|nr:ATP-binding protein [Thermosulfurimonas marina]QJA05431.1 GAF domain-containing protein [Thermosulfurimonas marina]